MHLQRIDDDLELVPFDGRLAGDYFALVDGDRAHLRPWCPWVDEAATVDDMRRIVDRAIVADDRVDAWIRYRGALIGDVQLSNLRVADRSGSIGYFVSRAYEGRGLATRAARALLDHGFDALELHRIELRCSTANARSLAVAARLGFRREGTLRDAERVDGRFTDVAVFGLLAGEWRGAS